MRTIGIQPAYTPPDHRCGEPRGPPRWPGTEVENCKALRRSGRHVHVGAAGPSALREPQEDARGYVGLRRMGRAPSGQQAQRPLGLCENGASWSLRMGVRITSLTSVMVGKLMIFNLNQAQSTINPLLGLLTLVTTALTSLCPLCRKAVRISVFVSYEPVRTVLRTSLWRGAL